MARCASWLLSSGEIIPWMSKLWKTVGSCVFFCFLAFYTGKLILDHFILSLPDMVMPSNVLSGSSAKDFFHLFTSFLSTFPPSKWFQGLTFTTFVKSASFFLNIHPSVPPSLLLYCVSLAIVAVSPFEGLFASFIPTALKYWFFLSLLPVTSTWQKLHVVVDPFIASCRPDFQGSSLQTHPKLRRKLFLYCCDYGGSCVPSPWILTSIPHLFSLLPPPSFTPCLVMTFHRICLWYFSLSFAAVTFSLSGVI